MSLQPTTHVCTPGGRARLPSPHHRGETCPRPTLNEGDPFPDPGTRQEPVPSHTELQPVRPSPTALLCTRNSDCFPGLPSPRPALRFSAAGTPAHHPAWLIGAAGGRPPSPAAAAAGPPTGVFGLLLAHRQQHGRRLLLARAIPLLGHGARRLLDPGTRGPGGGSLRARLDRHVGADRPQRLWRPSRGRGSKMSGDSAGGAGSGVSTPHPPARCVRSGRGVASASLSRTTPAPMPDARRADARCPLGGPRRGATAERTRHGRQSALPARLLQGGAPGVEDGGACGAGAG